MVQVLLHEYGDVYTSFETSVFLRISSECLLGNSWALYFIFPDGVALVIKRTNHQSFSLVFLLFPFHKISGLCMCVQ